MSYNRDMKEINIEQLKDIKNDLESLEDDEVIFVNREDETEYVVMTKSLYDSMGELAEIVTNLQSSQPVVKVVGPEEKIELSYDEYENVKKQMLDILDKTFKPNPEKLS